ncbi:MAG: hypothetical protein ACD_79C00045G0001, partial [uncultured bacterium]
KIGAIPKAGSPCVGYQYFPKIKSCNETTLKIGRELIKSVSIIPIKKTDDENAVTQNNHLYIFSLIL